MKVPYIKYLPLEKLVKLKLNPTQMILASIVVSFHKTGNLRVGYPKIAEAAHISEKTAERNLAKLAEMKLIIIKSGKAERNANEYIPTKKLLKQYSQNVPIDRDKMVNHTSSKEEYNRIHSKDDSFSESPSHSSNPETTQDDWSIKNDHLLLEMDI
jgi:hypothetical protein